MPCSLFRSHFPWLVETFCGSPSPPPLAYSLESNAPPYPSIVLITFFSPSLQIFFVFFVLDFFGGCLLPGSISYSDHACRCPPHSAVFRRSGSFRACGSCGVCYFLFLPFCCSLWSRYIPPLFPTGFPPFPPHSIRVLFLAHLGFLFVFGGVSGLGIQVWFCVFVVPSGVRGSWFFFFFECPCGLFFFFVFPMGGVVFCLLHPSESKFPFCGMRVIEAIG